MRYIQFVLAGLFLFSTSQAFSANPCGAYLDTCKNDPSVTGAAAGKAKWEARKSCIASAAKADTANGQKCLDQMASAQKANEAAVRKQQAFANCMSDAEKAGKKLTRKELIACVKSKTASQPQAK